MATIKNLYACSMVMFYQKVKAYTDVLEILTSLYVAYDGATLYSSFYFIYFLSNQVWFLFGRFGDRNISHCLLIHLLENLSFCITFYIILAVKSTL